MTENFPRGFDPARSILFLGSGFTAEAENTLGESPPVGDGLRRKIEQQVETDTEGDLKDVAYYAHSRGYDLHGLLDRLFVINTIGDNQRVILEQDWKRIYTTNYDDCVERYERDRDSRTRRRSFSIEDTRPAKLPPGTIIHLHGYIHNCNNENVLSQLVLDHRSYAEQAANSSPWWDQFERDIRGSQQIFFVGYSLSDFTVAAYLTRNPNYVKKTHFILRSPVSEFAVSRLSSYGEIHPISVSGFAEECNHARPGAPISSLLDLSAFRYIDPYKDNKSTRTPTPLEIDALLTRGKVNAQLLASNHSIVSYTIPRKDKIDEAIQKIENCCSLILHSRTANGKSVISEQIAIELHRVGYTCLRYKGHASIPPKEVEFLLGLTQACIFIGSYDDAIGIADELHQLSGKAKLIIEINTGTDQIRRSEVQSGLPKTILRVDVNNITRSDLHDFEELLDKAGISSVGLSSSSSTQDIRDILLRVLESPFVVEKLDAVLRPILDNRPATHVLAAISVLKALGINVGIDFVRAVVKTDPYDALLQSRGIVAEFADFDEDVLSPYSATFSEFFLKKYIGGTGIVGIIAHLALEAIKRVNAPDAKNSQRKREARRALGSLMQYRNLEIIFRGFQDRAELISRLYEYLRDNIHVNKEPLFWLQYSIFMQASGEYAMAKNHMQVAYDRADRIPGFRTFQLDTNYLKLFLQLPMNISLSVDDVEEIFSLLEKVRDMIVGEDNRLHAFRVLEDLENFSRHRGKEMSSGDRQRLSIICLGIVNDLRSLPVESQIEFGTNITMGKVESAISELARSERSQ